ncbi:MAG: UDP-N-acetylmuramoyl-tripeptide--D-alanyl-D-alanine ligase [Marinilabiliales bacterium]|nr:MAG: UDP-N-acetylmuramoyl-tripeptide--D-alanyl-D-alanine ligase [Marinilabiliales bacterium]
MNIEDLYKIFIKNKKVTTDSRIVEKDAIFFALRGETFNGNRYAEKAIENGCSWAIIDDKKYAKDTNFIVVDDVLETLQRLANYHRKQLGINILAITGTNGKTTTKELVASVLSKKYKVTFTKGNLNNHIGVPLTLLSMTDDTQIGVVEMGANHVGEIKNLCELAEPDYGIITNIGKAHLEGFGSIENIINTKSELYDYIKKINGEVFYNFNNELLANKVRSLELNAIDFGGASSTVKGKLLPNNELLSLEIQVAELKLEIHTNLVGDYNLENVLASVCIGNYFGVQPTGMLKAIEEYVPKNNRSQFFKTNKNNIYLDAYNANPSSVELSVNNFAGLQKKNAIVILGDMLELGNEAVSEHLKIVNLVHQKAFSKVILVGQVYSSLKIPNDFLQFKNVNELKKWLLENNLDSANVLIKGSRGIQLETIVEYL